MRASPAVAILVLLTACAGLVPPGVAAPLPGATADIDAVCANLPTGFADKTTAANDATVNDVTLAKSSVPADPTSMFFGFDAPFSGLLFDIGTAGIGGTASWSYWSGAAWDSLTRTDSTADFTLSGVHAVLFTPPANWATRVIDAAACPGAKYFLKVTTGTTYTTAPLANQVSGIPYNLRLKVTTETGTPFTGLVQGAFTVTGGTDNAVLRFRETGGGVYDFALHADVGDVTYDVVATVDGYVTSAAKATPALSSALTDLSSAPLTLAYAFKVTGVTTEASTSVPDATVTTGDAGAVLCAPSQGAYFCPVPLAQTDLTVHVLRDGYVTNAAKTFSQDRTAAADPQRTVAVTGLLFTLRVAVAGETSLSNIAWEKKAGSGAYEGVTPTAKVANVAYFAQPPTEANIVVRATKQTSAGETGDPFTSAADAQTVRTITLVAGAGTTVAPAGVAGVDPTDVVFDGVDGGVLRGPKLHVTWTPAAGATDYALYASDADTFDAAHARLLAASAHSPIDATVAEGAATFTLVARAVDGSVSHGVSKRFTVDAAPPVSTLLVSPALGPAVLLAWTATDTGSGVDHVDLFAQDGSAEPHRVHTSRNPTGDFGFLGLVGHTYRFSSQATDKVGQVEGALQTAPTATDVVSNRVDPAPQELARLSAPDAPAPAPFFATDEDGDSVPETFSDPTGRFQEVRGLLVEDGQPGLVLADTSNAETYVVWTFARGTTDPALGVLPDAPPRLEVAPDGQHLAKVRVRGTGWLLIEVGAWGEGRSVDHVVDPQGKTVPAERVWSQGPKVVVLDHAKTGQGDGDEVVVYYKDAAAAPPRSPILLWVSLAALATIPLAFLAWILAPGLKTLERRMALHRTRGSGWSLRHCATCIRPLPRSHRLVRALHRCAAPLADRTAHAPAATTAVDPSPKP